MPPRKKASKKVSKKVAPVTGRSEISKQVNQILKEDSARFGSFERAKDAYNYFIDNYSKLRMIVTYDNFHYYWTKMFPGNKLTNRRKEIGSLIEKPTIPVAVPGADLKELHKADDLELIVYDPRNAKVQDELFVPMKTGKAIDIMISKKGGFMPGTTLIIFADGGVGKSTLVFDAQYSLKKNNPDLEVMALSAEMTEVDLKSELEEKKWMYDVQHILLSKYTPAQYITLIQKVILYGYDFLSVDSFQTILEKLVDKCHMNRNQAKNFLIDLFKRANEGETKTGKHTCIFCIQQVNKDGNFVGANSLKHDTTAMLVAKMNDEGERFFYNLKNRRNGGLEKKPMFFYLDGNSEVTYDLHRWEQEREREKVINKNQVNLEKGKELFGKVFDLGEAKGGRVVPVTDDFDLDLDREDDDDEM